jgi:hypothetical protein
MEGVKLLPVAVMSPVVPASKAAGSIEIELGGAVRVRVDAAVDEAAQGCERCADDRAALGDAGLAGEWSDGYAPRLRRPGAAGARCGGPSSSAIWWRASTGVCRNGPLDLRPPVDAILQLG